MMENEEVIKSIKFAWWVGFWSGLISGTFLAMVLIKFT